MKFKLPTSYLSTIVKAGITHIHAVPDDVVIRKGIKPDMNYLPDQGVQFYLKSQYNIDLKTDTLQDLDHNSHCTHMTEQGLRFIDKQLSSMYSVASPNTMYYKFDELDATDLPFMYLNAIMHYAFDYYSTSKELVFDIGGNEKRLPGMKSLNLENMDKTKPLMELKVLPWIAFIGDLYNSIVNSKTSVSDDDLDLLHLLITQTGRAVEDSAQITNRDVAMVQEASIKEVDSLSAVRINSLSDLLRYVNIQSYWKQGAIYNSQVAPEQLKLTTHQQKIVTSVFHNYVARTKDVRKIKQELAQHVSDWKKVFMLVNKYNNEETKAVWVHFRKVIFTEHLRSQNSEIESAVASGDARQFDQVFHKYPSLAIRHLVDFTAKSKEMYAPSDESLDKIPMRILLQTENRLITLAMGSNEDVRLSKLKGKLSITPENGQVGRAKHLFMAEAQTILTYIVAKVRKTSLPDSGEEDKGQSYDLAMNTDNLTKVDNAITLPYLSQVYLGDNNLVSPMIYWEEEEADLDLSVVLYDEKFQTKGRCAYTDLHYKDIAKHSGDITHATKEEPAVERVLIDRQKALADGAKYAIVTTTVYTGSDSTVFRDGVATYDKLEDSSDMYSPEGLANLGSLQAQGTQLYLFVIDLEKNIEYVINKPLDSENMQGNNTYSMSENNGLVAKLILRDSNCVLHFSDLYGDGTLEHKPESQFQAVDNLNKIE